MPRAHRPDAELLAFADTMQECNDLLDSVTPSDLFADSGLPGDRLARFAARRAFVELKQIFMQAVAGMHDRKGQWLRYQVRLANDPLDLWMLRGPVLSALRDNDPFTRGLRAELYRGLDSLFPDACGQGGSMQPPLPQPWEIWSAGRQSAALSGR
jgi:hypothetical protein